MSDVSSLMQQGDAEYSNQSTEVHCIRAASSLPFVRKVLDWRGRTFVRTSWALETLRAG